MKVDEMRVKKRNFEIHFSKCIDFVFVQYVC